MSEQQEPVSEDEGRRKDPGQVQDDTAPVSARSAEAIGQPGVSVEADTGEDELEALRVEVNEARHQAEDNWNHYLRARADLDNLRRRMERELEQVRRHAVEALAVELLAVRDSLEMGLTAASDGQADVDKLREGTELTLRLLTQAMDKGRIQVIDPQGERFDPEQHEAMAMQPSEEQAPNTVLMVVQKGYRLNERLLRPARVIVASAAAGQS